MGRKYKDFLRHRTQPERYVVIDPGATMADWTTAGVPGKVHSSHRDLQEARETRAARVLALAVSGTPPALMIWDRWTQQEVK
jgi:hypothetical protein